MSDQASIQALYSRRSHSVEVALPVPITNVALMNSEQFAARLGVTPRFVRRLVEQRRVPFLKIGKFVRFDPDEIERWIAGQRPFNGKTGRTR